MVEQMEKQMDAESAADEQSLRERIMETARVLDQLRNEYQEKFGAPPMALNLSPAAAQFVADEDDRADFEDFQNRVPLFETT